MEANEVIVYYTMGIAEQKVYEGEAASAAALPNL
jgi:hypothetical protein